VVKDKHAHKNQEFNPKITPRSDENPERPQQPTDASMRHDAAMAALAR
jgi:hypothetical protein